MDAAKAKIMDAAKSAKSAVAKSATLAETMATDVAKPAMAAETKATDAAAYELNMQADGRFDDGFCMTDAALTEEDAALTEEDTALTEENAVLTEEDMARATEVVVPAPDAVSMAADLSITEAAASTPAAAAMPDIQAEATRQPVPYVSQQEFPSAALMSDAGRRVSPGRVAAVSATAGVAGVCVASVLTKEDASLSRAATPDDEKSADEIASNVGVGDDVERVEVPIQPHVTVTCEDLTAAAGGTYTSADAGGYTSGTAVSYGADYASVDPSGMDDMSTGFDDTYDTLG